MFKEFVILSCIASIALAYPPSHDNGWQQPQQGWQKPQQSWQQQPQHGWQKQQEEAPANYDFNYEVHEVATGDIKRQKEMAKDGHISGEYSLVEPDGIHRRIVTYTADDEHGFKVNPSVLKSLKNILK